MSTVSKLPGRLRLEIKELINKRCHCRLLELKILEIKGVMQAEANHRTGRLLVTFDETVIDSRALVLAIRDILDEMVECREKDYETLHKKNTSDSKSITLKAISHAAIDIAGHMLMPKPFNILFPIAVKALRDKVPQTP